MPARTRRHLELLALSRPLHHYARSLQADVNASYMLVHHAMSKAFAKPSEPAQPAACMAASLRADLRDRFQRAV